MAEGRVVKLQAVDDYLANHVHALSWHKGGWFHFSISPQTIFQNLLKVMDDLIKIVESAIPSTIDQKATILAALDSFYSMYVVAVFPSYLKPFSGVIQKVFDGIFSQIIDFIINKYKGNLATN